MPVSGSPAVWLTSWLAEHGRGITTMTEADLETYLHAHPGRATIVAPLLKWSDRSGITTDVSVPTKKTGPPVATAASSPRTRYYAESGTPPERFLVPDWPGLDDGSGIADDAVVAETMLFRMLGMLADPIIGQPLALATQ